MTSSAPNTEPTNVNSGSLHSFYRLDRQTGTVYGPSWIPVGATVESDNTQIHVIIGGTEHMLTLGNDNYPPGYCGNFPIVSQAGTTPATITRSSNTHWTVSAPTGSIGRLYKRTSSGNWTYLGLYFVNFVSEIDAQ